LKHPLCSLVGTAALAFVVGSEVHAQRLRRMSTSPPFLPGGASRPLEGDSPLTELARFAGRVDVFVQALPYNSGPTSGTFDVGIPGGATILHAWLLITSFDHDATSIPVSLDFAGDLHPARFPDVIDLALFHSPASLYRFDVTSSVGGSGSYPYTAATNTVHYGDALVVVYEHPSLPLRTLALHDGAEGLFMATSSTTFQGMPSASGELTLFVQADNPSDLEEVRLNGLTVAGPADLFAANLGNYASLVTLPVAVQSGANEMDFTTSDDHLGLNLAILAANAVGLGFDTEDDFATPLVNGQALSSPPHFGRLVSISSIGPNAGAAIFDASPGGPNDPGQDLDLLVGRGNVVILQDPQASTQGMPGVFDRPNDAQGGGDLVFSFAAPLRPLSLVLIDIDAGTSQASSVRMTDAAGRERTYLVPPRWTEDLLLDGPTGWRTLDLQSLAPQPGFQSIATATQSPGFDPASVVRLTVHLGSSGAVDDLVLASG